MPNQSGPQFGVNWNALLAPPAAVALVLLVLPQFFFIRMSFHEALEMGRVSEDLTLLNYLKLLTDDFYLRSLWLTLWLSLSVTLVNLLIGFPVAYFLARLRSRAVSYFVVLLLISSFVSVVVKVLGLSIMLSRDGAINQGLMALGLVSTPLRMTNNELGVVIGLVQYTLPLMIMLLVSVVQTIPVNLEQAAEVSGAGAFSKFRSVILPLAMPGVISGSLLIFSLNMGAFAATILLGGGRVLTFPVLIQRKIILDVNYAEGATLSTILFVFVLAVNIALSRMVIKRARSR